MLSQWIRQCNAGSKQRVILVSGRGQAIDTGASELDNSTQFTAQLVKLFIDEKWPMIACHLIHSDDNLFRYDSNIMFVKKDLVPFVSSLRNDVVRLKREKWRDHLRLTLSFADGSSARISAINQSLRHYQPSYMHFWQLKSFWREQKVYHDDVESHTFEEIATEPAMRISMIKDPLILAAVNEIDAFHSELIAALRDNNHDITDFWLRKTLKPVLAVLIVQKEGEGQEIKRYRGTNLEVSLPTGSLCAERNAIGSAFSADLTLKREDIKLVAVYSPENLEQYHSQQHSEVDNRSRQPSSFDYSAAASPGSRMRTDSNSSEHALPIIDTNSNQDLLTPNSRGSHKKVSVKQIRIYDHNLPETEAKATAVENSHSNTGDSNTTTPKKSGKRSSSFSFPERNAVNDNSSSNRKSATTNTPRKRQKQTRSIVFATNASAAKTSNVSSQAVDTSSSLSEDLVNANGTGVSSSSSAAPLLCQQVGSVPNFVKVETIEGFSGDLNPLKPCGACASWLQKIVKVNPDFKVVTFTDLTRQGVYVECVHE